MPPSVKAALTWLAVTATAGLAFAQPSAGDYQRSIDSALAEYQLGHYEEARALMQHAHELEPSARTLRGLGMVEYELRHYVQASELLEQALASGSKPLPDDQRAEVRDLLERTNHLIARYRLEVHPVEAAPTIEVDRQPFDVEEPLKLTVGEHTVRVSAEGYEPSERHIDAKGGEHKTLRIALHPRAGARPEVSLAPVERPYPHRTLGIVLTSVGGAALATGGLLGGLALSRAENASARGDADAERARSLALGSDVAIAIGAASALTGVVLWLWRGPAREQPAASRVDTDFTSVRVRF